MSARAEWRVQPMNGRWSVNGVGSYYTVAVGQKGRRAPIALVIQPMADESDAKAVDDHARVVASAPALLKALKDLYADYYAVCDASGHQLELTPVGRQARAALSLAEGEG